MMRSSLTTSISMLTKNRIHNSCRRLRLRGNPRRSVNRRFWDSDSGEIILNGWSRQWFASLSGPINTVFQRYALFPHLNVFDNIAFGLPNSIPFMKNWKAKSETIWAGTANAAENLATERSKRKAGNPRKSVARDPWKRNQRADNRKKRKNWSNRSSKKIRKKDTRGKKKIEKIRSVHWGEGRTARAKSGAHIKHSRLKEKGPGRKRKTIDFGPRTGSKYAKRNQGIEEDRSGEKN